MHLDLGQIAGAPLLGLLAFYAGYSRLFLTLGIICLAAAVVYGLFAEAHLTNRTTPTSLASDSSGPAN
jgi:hypothetical protein